MNNELYTKAINILGSRRQRALTDVDLHIAEAEGKIPQISEVNAQISKTSCEIAKLIISKPADFSEKLEEIHKTNVEGQRIIAELLTKNGYPEDYFRPHFTCDKCSDTGFIDGRRCSCLSELLEKLAVDELNSNSLVELCDFKSFDLSYYNNPQNPQWLDTMTKIRDYCVKYAESFSKNSPNIFMLGNPGLGKTHLSLSIAKAVLEKGYSVAYDSIINYLGEIEKEHFRRSEGDTLTPLLNVDLLILDDLGSEFESSFNVSTIYNIINTRINRGLPTIISSNISREEIQKRYNDRIVSRLFTMYDCLRFAGTDIRQQKRINR